MDSLLPWFCTVIDDRRHDNTIRNLRHSWLRLMCHVFVFKTSVIYCSINSWQHGIFLSNKKWKIENRLFAPSKNPMKPPWYGKCFDRQIWHFSKRNNLNSSRFLLALFTAHHMWHMSSLLHTFQSSYFSKRGITCSPTTIYCYRIYRSFSHMQTRLAILLPYRDNNGSCTFLRKAPGKHGSYKFFDSFLLSPSPHKKIFWGNSSEIHV